MRFSRSEGMLIDTKLKGDEDGLINLSIGVLVAVLSTSEAVGGVEDGDTLLVAQVWVGPSGGCRTYRSVRSSSETDPTRTVEAHLVTVIHARSCRFDEIGGVTS